MTNKLNGLTIPFRGRVNDMRTQVITYINRPYASKRKVTTWLDAQIV